MRLIGTEALQAKFKKAGKLAQTAIDAGSYNVGLTILAQAIPGTPKKWGVLRGSGYVALPKNGEVTVGFGGPAAAYAWPQHENMTFKHAVGGPKFLENALYAVAPKALDIWARILRRVLVDGGGPPSMSGAPNTPWQGPRGPTGGTSGKRRRRK
jgi:hypothetical protein